LIDEDFMELYLAMVVVTMTRSS